LTRIARIKSFNTKHPTLRANRSKELFKGGE